MSDIIKINTDLRSIILDKTKESYRTEIKQFLAAAGDDLSFEGVKQYIHDLKRKGFKATTVNKHIAAVKHMIRVIFRDPDLTVLQTYKLETALQEIEPFTLNNDSNIIQADKVISKMELMILKLKSPEYMALVMEFLYATGCRISEALNIKLSDLDAAEDKYNIEIIGKGKKARTIRVSIELIEKIKSCFQSKTYLFERDGKQLQRNDICNKVKRLSKKHINRVITPHCFRHSFATHKIRETGKIKGVSEYIGHASTAITMDMYNHEVLNDDELF